jgi:hypothetical protein
MRPIVLVDHATGVTVSDLKIDGSLADGGAPTRCTLRFPEFRCPILQNNIFAKNELNVQRID